MLKIFPLSHLFVIDFGRDFSQGNHGKMPSIGLWDFAIRSIFEKNLKKPAFTSSRSSSVVELKTQKMTFLSNLGTKGINFCNTYTWLLHGLIWSRMLFSNFWSSTRWLFQKFFEKFQNDNFYFNVPYTGTFREKNPSRCQT